MSSRVQLPQSHTERNPRPIASGSERPALVVRRLGVVEYESVWHSMQLFTTARTPASGDELWLLQHPPVYTLGLAGRSEHLRARRPDVPIIKVDRGGQVTYHGPGQIVVYCLLDLRRLKIGVRSLVHMLEQSVIEVLSEYGVRGHRREQAPGVYVDGDKIAALGLRIRNGCSYHGLSLNVDMDLAPFLDIDPCGYPDLRVTQARELGISDNIDTLGERLVAALRSNLEPETA